MQYTQNYNLKKPDPDDYYDVRDFNDNSNIIDEKMFEHTEKIRTLTETTTSLNDRLTNDENNLTSHLAETVSKVVLVTEPFDQMTKTTVNLGFRPKLITIQASILGTKYESIGFSDGASVYMKELWVSNNTTTISGNYIASFIYDASNRLLGALSITDTGIEITWTLTGTLTGASGSRRLIISATTH